ncbi:hypothetical protein FNV43_RR24576 [Rhamnella rubrinervis]|uniref:Uncharacterized protein n=1 Tax=Rhamnella rubrinervis TaxID=2594499 RepID=A0A8K0DST8_9ROSA|nr:hypothetical protein FNV43_RR24576 [Rhamnella rubrinervis]
MAAIRITSKLLFEAYSTSTGEIGLQAASYGHESPTTLFSVSVSGRIRRLVLNLTVDHSPLAYVSLLFTYKKEEKSEGMYSLNKKNKQVLEESSQVTLFLQLRLATRIHTYTKLDYKGDLGEEIHFTDGNDSYKDFTGKEIDRVIWPMKKGVRIRMSFLARLKQSHISRLQLGMENYLTKLLLLPTLEGLVEPLSPLLKLSRTASYLISAKAKGVELDADKKTPSNLGEKASPRDSSDEGGSVTKESYSCLRFWLKKEGAGKDYSIQKRKGVRKG